MTNVAILDVRLGGGRDVSNSYMVAYRNLSVLRDTLGADLFINPSDIRFSKRYDAIICGFGSTSCEKDLSTKFINSNPDARVYWLIGEYEQSTFAPLFYSDRHFTAIKNFEHKIRNKRCLDQVFLNINTLLCRKPNRPHPKKYDCVYYGRWRPDRLGYFKQYLDSTVHLSTAKKNMKMFHHNGCNPKMVAPMTWTAGREQLNLYRASLYIEDKFTHHHYNCLGNRFYEALWCNVVPLFDKSCVGTLEKSGYQGWEWHIVENSGDIAKKCREIDSGKTGALELWQEKAMIESSGVKATLKEMICNPSLTKSVPRLMLETA